MNKSGTFYSVGVGPGDPMLITLKAIAVIEACEIIAVPNSGSGENLALKIAEKYIGGKQILSCEMPMMRDKTRLDEHHDRVAHMLAEHLEKGEDVAFLTLGDPTIYSTAMYIHQRLKGDGFATKIIAGVPSFCAAAASLGVALCEGGEMLQIVPASYPNVDSALELSGNKVLMKSGKSFASLKEKLHGKNAMMVERASMKDDGEKIHPRLDEADDAGYFSLIIVKE